MCTYLKPVFRSRYYWRAKSYLSFVFSLARWHALCGMWLVARWECCVVSPVCVDYLQPAGTSLSKGLFCVSGIDGSDIELL
jgi:hypothetical protein